MSSKIRIAIVGCGRAAELIYLPVLLKNGDCVVTAAIDPVRERREWFGGNIKGCTPAESLDESVINSIDAAVISTPPSHHVLISEVLLKHNKHVLVEKPLSLTMENISNLIETSGKSAAHLLMAFNHRYWEPVVNLKSIISQQRITNAEIIFSGNYSLWNPVSFHSDSINDLGPHVFDLIRYLFDQEINSVAVSSEKENHFAVTVRTSNGINIKTLIAHSDKTEKVVRVQTNHKEYFVALGSSRIEPVPGIKRKLVDFQDTLLRKVQRKTSPIKHSYEIQFESFLNLVKSNTPLRPNINDGIASLKSCIAAHLSIIRKEEVCLDEIQ